MCFYYAVVKTNAKALIKNGIIKEEQLSLFPDKQFVKGFDFPFMPVISNDNPALVQMFRWGFVPQHTQNTEKATAFLNQYNTLNAKAENLFESRLFSNELMELVHNTKKRMPQIIEPENAMKWLNSDLSDDEIKSYFKPFDSSQLKATPIKKLSPRLNYENDPGITVYYHYQELSAMMAQYPQYFEKTVDFRGEAPTLF